MELITRRLITPALLFLIVLLEKRAPRLAPAAERCREEVRAGFAGRKGIAQVPQNALEQDAVGQGPKTSLYARTWKTMLVRTILRGAMGSVFLARRRADGKRLALKTVAIAAAKDRQLALNEIAILKSLDHPHVVHFVDSFVADEELCIAMEYCAGGDLTALLARQRSAAKRLPEVEVRSMIAQLASALAHVHSRRIVHRDIKSSNVFLRAAHPGGGAGVATRLPTAAVAPASPAAGRLWRCEGTGIDQGDGMHTVRHTILPPSRGVQRGFLRSQGRPVVPGCARVRGLCS